MNSAKNILIPILIFVCLQTANAGWKKNESGTLAWLRAVYFVDQNRGWITGSQGTFLATDDGGKSWKQNRRFTEDNIRDVYFSDAKNGWLLCERDIYSLGSASISYLLKTADGGNSWEKVEFSGSRERITRIFFAIGGYGFAVGESGTLLVMQGDMKTWKKAVLPARVLLMDGNFSDALNGTLVGGNGTILFSDDAGLTWNLSTVTGAAKPRLNTVFFINPKTGWAAGAEGKIYATINGGKSWREQSSPVAKSLSDIFFLNTAEGFAVGDEGAILHTTTAGNVWNVEEPIVKHKLERIFFTGKKGFAVGFGGTILSYEPASEDKKQPTQPQLQRRNYSANFLSPAPLDRHS